MVVPGDLRLLCYLNQSAEEAVQSIFYNQLDESLVVCSSFNHQILKSRSIRLRAIEMGHSRGALIFEGENVSFPGWLEYDDQKHRVLTYNHQTRCVIRGDALSLTLSLSLSLSVI